METLIGKRVRMVKPCTIKELFESSHQDNPFLLLPVGTEGAVVKDEQYVLLVDFSDTKLIPANISSHLWVVDNYVEVIE